jgi:hypothetical protein
MISEDWEPSEDIETDLLRIFEQALFYDCTFRAFNESESEVKFCEEEKWGNLF